MEFDKDLRSIQEVRDIVAAAKAAQAEYAEYTQEQMDKICLAVTRACEQNLEKLAKMANEETGYGVWQDKVLKNRLGSTMTYDSF
ncbi:MAG: acetaldehyde dehydrogenase, partial [Firmicutes bacterium]|nr:acetaldehyde dehydrogenase [Bacillota bacterium]